MEHAYYIKGKRNKGKEHKFRFHVYLAAKYDSKSNISACQNPYKPSVWNILPYAPICKIFPNAIMLYKNPGRNTKRQHHKVRNKEGLEAMKQEMFQVCILLFEITCHESVTRHQKEASYNESSYMSKGWNEARTL